MYIEHFEKDVDKENNQYNKRLAMITVISKWDEREAEDFIRSLGRLIDFQKDNQDKWAFPKRQEPCTLLHRFWQSKSDACPVDATIQEKQEEDFSDWVCEQYEQLSIIITKPNRIVGVQVSDTTESQ